jgi:TRAP transporter TAXI family solute receptor
VLRRRPFTLAAAATFLAAAGGVRGQAPTTRNFTIGAGPIGGTYFPVAGLIATAISNPPGGRPCDAGGNCGVPGLIAEAVATQGSVENIKRMAEGTLDAGLAQADIAAAALAGDETFGGKPVGVLRAAANLFPEAVHIVVRRDRDLDSIADLRGRTLSLGELGSGTLPLARTLLNAYGLGRRDVVTEYLSPQAASHKLREGTLDAFIMVAGQPAPLLVGLARQVEIELLPISSAVADLLRRDRPGITTLTTPAGMYQGVDACDSIAVGSQLVVSNSVDEEIVYGSLRALFHPSVRARLDRGHPAAALIKLETALDGLAVPLHAGAKRFYKERGLLKD